MASPNIYFRRKCDCGDRSAECVAHIPLLGPRNINPSDADRVFTQSEPPKVLFIEHKQTREEMKYGQKLLLTNMDSVASNAGVLVVQGTPRDLTVFEPTMSGGRNQVKGTVDTLQATTYAYFDITTPSAPRIDSSVERKCPCGGKADCVAHREIFGPEGYPSITIDRVFDDAETKRLLFVQHYLPGERVSEADEFHLRNLAKVSPSIGVWITRGTYDDLRITCLGNAGENASQDRSSFPDLQERVFEWYGLPGSDRADLRAAQAEGQRKAEAHHGPTLRLVGAH